MRHFRVVVVEALAARIILGRRGLQAAVEEPLARIRSGLAQVMLTIYSRLATSRLCSALATLGRTFNPSRL